MYFCPPNLTDYVAFLYGVVELPAANLPTASGVAQSGTTTALVDQNQNWTPNQWAPFGFTYLMTDTTQNVSVPITSNTVSSVSFNPLPAPVNAGDAYWLTPPIVPGTLALAMETVNTQLACTAHYSLCVYNLAADRLINFANDLPNQTFYADLRKRLKITTVSLWVTSGASDQGTSQQGMIPEQLKLLTIDNLQMLKTPYGRMYMGMAQDVGTLWGMS